jgi:hypothetical protein
LIRELGNIIFDSISKINGICLQYDDLNTVKTNFFQW